MEAAKAARRLDHTPLEIDDDSFLRFAKGNIKNHGPSQKCNGRQIRNAFQVACSLAQFNMGNKDPDDSDDTDDDLPQAIQDNGERVPIVKRRPRLDSTHFNIVSESVERFDRYLFKTLGADADTARNHSLRNDNYHDPREDDRMSAGIDYQSAQRRHNPPELAHSPSGRGSVFDVPDPREDDRRSSGHDYESARLRHPLPELVRSHGGRHGSVFDVPVPSPKIPPRGFMDDEDEDEDDSDSDGSGGGLGSGNYKMGSRGTPAREPLFSSHSSPAVIKIKGGKDRHYRQKGMASGDALSPDDTGYGRGGSISSGRANSYGHGGY